MNFRITISTTSKTLTKSLQGMISALLLEAAVYGFTASAEISCFVTNPKAPRCSSRSPIISYKLWIARIQRCTIEVPILFH